MKEPPRIQLVGAPMLDAPVLLIESDDWGPAPVTHAAALNRIRDVLRQHTDRQGHHPVMTIGVILSIPDKKQTLQTGTYAARYLNDPEYHSLVEALQAGQEEGVFHLQLHGMAHYWPDNLMAELKHNPEVRELLASQPWHTERMPSWLQSRWIDARSLPSRPLTFSQVQQAVEEELELFRKCFGTFPKVVVPPTFVWTDEVEQAYAQAGIEVLITPGRRYPGRDEEGRLQPPDRPEVNGNQRVDRLTTLVRDLYFEPSLGHTPEEVLKKIEWKWSRREPALLETHRFNFLGEKLEPSLEALDRLLELVTRHLPQTRFCTPPELVSWLKNPPPLPFSRRLEAAWRRLRW